MVTVDKAKVLERLAAVPGPDGGDIVSLGLVSDVFIADGRVAFSITVPETRARELEPLRRAAEAAVLAIPGVERAMVALTAERHHGPGRVARPRPPAAPLASAESAAAAAPSPAAAPARPAAQQGVPGVGLLIAVASGKGGVGKSTTAVNLALALKERGLKVGVLDADVYGPSVPRLLGLTGRPQTVDGRRLMPLEAYGLKAMSIGLLIEEDTPMIWRGPMVVSALRQMLMDVAWGELDVIVIDMPPGTGDVQLSLAQQAPLAGAVIVSTPQDLALLDARKGLAMFRKVEVPVLGIVENMSTFICPHCGEASHIFGHGGARHEAERLGVPFLGEIPLAMTIRETSDAGAPVMASAPDGPHAAAYRAVAGALWQEVQARRNSHRRPPQIVIE
ncbi:Mrp/NBP35 family ATP-binding protein [Pseudoxanthobacter sp.]|uniref:Mrp/NBP35 family ATP-binding protein n=1 Tax=Pseudoxanthobacter sp. TaxID=1925742 RepID=UPI002FDF6DBC